MAKKNNMPMAEVKAPQMRDRVRHSAMESESFLLMPYIKWQPTIWASPFMVIQVPIRSKCSFLRY